MYLHSAEYLTCYIIDPVCSDTVAKLRLVTLTFFPVVSLSENVDKAREFLVIVETATADTALDVKCY